jgi:acetoin utilization protein AcuB
MTMRHDPIDPCALPGVEHPAFPAAPLRVADRMTWPAVTVDWDAPVSKASRLMEEHRIRHLPVLDAQQRLIGILTDGDLAEALAAEAIWDASEAPSTLIVGKAMTWKPTSVPASCVLAEAVKLMYECKLSALPVVEDGRVIGILSEIDILREFVEVVARAAVGRVT